MSIVSKQVLVFLESANRVREIMRKELLLQVAQSQPLISLTASQLQLTCVNNLGAIPTCGQACRLASGLHLHH